MDGFWPNFARMFWTCVLLWISIHYHATHTPVPPWWPHYFTIWPGHRCNIIGPMLAKLALRVLITVRFNNRSHPCPIQLAPWDSTHNHDSTQTLRLREGFYRTWNISQVYASDCRLFEIPTVCSSRVGLGGYAHGTCLRGWHTDSLSEMYGNCTST